MPDNIPFEIQIEIIKLLPIKQLLRCRSVSKLWKSLIDSSNFVAKYHFNNHQLQHRLLVTYADSIHKVDVTSLKHEKYVSIVDDDSFPQHKFPINAPSDVTQLGEFPDIIGSSQGVLCFCQINRGFGFIARSYDTMTFVLWNPTIRKSIRIVTPKIKDFQLVVGFGVCPRTSDPKLVKITYDCTNKIMKKCIPLEVELFSLSSGSWRSLSMNLPRESIGLTWNQVCIDKFIYWLASDSNCAGQRVQRKRLILSFDMTTEAFTEIDLPNNLAYKYNGEFLLAKLWTSLVVLETEYVQIPVYCAEYCVWKMEHRVPNMFTKLFVIKSFDRAIVRDFRKTGEPIIEMFLNYTDVQNALIVYDPKSEEMSDIVIAGAWRRCLAKSYIKTLILLDQ